MIQKVNSVIEFFDRPDRSTKQETYKR